MNTEKAVASRIIDNMMHEYISAYEKQVIADHKARTVKADIIQWCFQNPERAMELKLLKVIIPVPPKHVILERGGVS